MKNLFTHISIIMLLLFVTHLSLTSVFMHSHVINGVIITHSHPHKKGLADEPVNHGHTPAELVVIQMITTVIAVAIILSGIVAAANLLLHKSSLLINIFIEPNSHNTLSLLRAPPLS